MFDKLLQFDRQFERYIYLHHPEDADSFLMWTTNHATIITFSFVLLLILIYVYNKNSKYLLAGIHISLIIGVSAIISNIIKLIIRRDRPYQIDDKIITPLIDSGGYSFPSGHTTEVFALAVAVFFIFHNPFLRMFSLFWAFWIAYTRMALGVHYPLDILGGIIIGSLTAYVFIKRISKYLI
jgi:membrane-associated phospholipid phosphatase